MVTVSFNSQATYTTNSTGPLNEDPNIIVNTAGPHNGDPVLRPVRLPTGDSRSKRTNNKFTISATQINLHRAKNAWNSLISNIVGHKNPIVLATEPYADNNNIIPQIHRDLTLFYYKGKDVRPRAAIAIHNQLLDKGWELTQFTTSDQVAIKLRVDGVETVIVSSYMDGRPGMAAPPKDLTRVVEYAKHNGLLPIIIGSDTNCHHYVWGNPTNDRRGDDLLDYMDCNGLSWANRGTTPTFVNSRGQSSIIDLTITNEKGST